MKHNAFTLSLTALASLALLCPVQAEETSSLTETMYDKYGLELNGFIDARGGLRLQDDQYERDASIGEIRMQLEAAKDYDWGLFKFKGDLLADGVMEEVTGEIRELSLLIYPLDIMDVKLGRQTLTWGTGDLIFINDMFPKDWQSFFIGRDNEYLKAPSDAVKFSLFSDTINLDFVYTPLFNSSTFISGERLSYYNPMLGEISGRNMILDTEDPNSTFEDAEYSLRLSRQFDGTELALYGYSGFWKEPEGFTPETGKLIYPRLSVYGASVRGTLLGGVASSEAGYYDSRQNRSGDDPTSRNSEIRFLMGFEREVATELTGAVQYYLEWMQDYQEYQQSQQSSETMRDEYRHMVTLRLTQLLLNQTMTISLFVYYSPSDNDGYLRPKISYKLTDSWIIDGGGNIFWGEDEHTFWGQFQDNTNLYAGLKYTF